MKRTTTILLLSTALLTLGGCRSWLDVDPELGVGEEQVFGTYNNMKAYLESYFNGDKKNTNLYCGMPLFMNMNDKRFTFVSTTDAADNGRVDTWNVTKFKRANLTPGAVRAFSDGKEADFVTDDTGAVPIARSMWRIIRIANKCIENIGMVADGTEEQIADLLGKAYFVRAYAHFALCRFYGGVPYLDHSLDTEDDWDMTRLSRHETYLRAADDFYTAYEYFEKAGKMRRDPFPGEPGFLTVTDLKQPHGTVSLGMRSRCLLYAASPLNNELGDEDWAAAAEATVLALKVAEEQHYTLLPFSRYTDNFLNYKGSEEIIWGGYWSETKDNSSSYSCILAYPQSNYSKAGGICPTQNFVDKYETAWGDPLNTEEDRRAAIAAGHYNDQDPYTDRDPRFYKTIVFDGCQTAGTGSNTINIYYDPATDSYPKTNISGTTAQFGIAWGSKDNGTIGYSNTGYYAQKFWDGKRGDKGVKHLHEDPILRLAELYLNYAEAVNEAYGPLGTAPGCDLTAADAVNIVRARAGMPPVQDRFTASKELFRTRIQNERCIEFAFEAEHYYFDIRRWKVAPECMNATLMGMYIESCPVDAAHPKGRRYERRPIPDNRQSTWIDAMYFFPFSDQQAQTMKNFVNNEPWLKTK